MPLLGKVAGPWLLLASARADFQLGPDGGGCADLAPDFSGIELEMECRVGMTMLEPQEDGFKGVINDLSFPYGCFKCVTGNPSCTVGVYFNTNTQGVGDDFVQSVCKPVSFLIEPGSTVFAGGYDIDHWHSSHDGYNVGVDGTGCHELLEDMPLILETFSPSKVVVECATEDVVNGVRFDRAWRRLKRVLRLITEAGATAILISPKPAPALLGHFDDFAELDHLARKFVRRNMGGSVASVVYVDVFSALFPFAVTNSAPLFESDDLTLSDYAYERYDNWGHAVDDDALGCAIWVGGSCTKQVAEAGEVVTNLVSNLDTCQHGRQMTSTFECQAALGLIAVDSGLLLQFHGHLHDDEYPSGCWICLEGCPDDAAGVYHNEVTPSGWHGNATEVATYQVCFWD